MSSIEERDALANFAVQEVHRVFKFPDAKVEVRTGQNYVFVMAVPNGPAEREILRKIEEMLRDDFGP